MNGNTGLHADCHCHYHPDLIVVRRGDEGLALEILNQDLADENPVVELDQGELLSYLDGLNDEDIGPIIERMALLRVIEDPHLSAQRLDEAGIEGSPVHGLGFMGHGGYKGDDFDDAPGSHPEVEPSEGESVIAVVDSGLAPDEDLPGWLHQPSTQVDRPQDTDVLPLRHPISHGTFVASVIRRIAPTHVVSITSARADPGYMVTDEEPHLPSGAVPTDELNVFGALVRLAKRHQETQNVVALNLALGAHECPGGGSFLLAMRIALDFWQDTIEGSEIFAAGGNSTCEARIYPAAWDDVRAVGAVEEGGRQIVWADGKPVADPGRDWITDWAPGQKILGMGGQNADHLVRWSGSSFACAVATACFAAGVTPTVVDNQSWWPDQAMVYNSIPDLDFLPQ